MDSIKFRLVGGFRIPAQDKNYWISQLQTFANQFASMHVKYVEYGKQDSRGIPSISLYDHNHCVPRQEHFKTNKELLQFVAGYNMARAGMFNRFEPFQSNDKLFKAILLLQHRERQAATQGEAGNNAN
jgi:hypothetical protein